MLLNEIIGDVICMRCNGIGFIQKFRDVDYGNGQIVKNSYAKLCPTCHADRKYKPMNVIDTKKLAAGDKE